jgi:hypothetical protein
MQFAMTAETVIESLEDAEDYATFEEAIAASFDPETAVERELILRLASLLWRLRRATSIETVLFQVKIEHGSGPQPASELSRSPPSHSGGIHVAPTGIRPSDDVGVIPTNTLRMRMQENRIALGWCFLRVINLTDDAFERLGRTKQRYGARFGRRCSRLRDCAWAVPPSVIDARTIRRLL